MSRETREEAGEWPGADFSRDALWWCFSSLGCPELQIDQMLELARRFGVRALELRAAGGTLDLAGYLRDWRTREPQAFAELARAGTVRMIDTSFALAAVGEADIANLLELAQLADALGARWLRVFGGFDYAPVLPQDKLQASAATIAHWTQLRAQHGLRCQLALETHDGFSSAAHCARLREAVGGALAVVWDAHHTFRCAGESFEESLRILGDSVVHIHVKDSVIKDGKTHSVLPGTGDVPVPALLALLRARGCQVPVSLEWEKVWEPELPPLAQALESARVRWL